MVAMLGWAVLIWWTAVRVEQADARRRLDEAALSEQYRRTEEARSRVRAVLDSTGDAMLQLGLDGVVLTVNRRFAQLFRVEPEQVLGQSLAAVQDALNQRVLVADDLSPPPTSWSDAVIGIPSTVLQIWPERRELELRSASVWSDEGNELGQLYTFRDVTSEREVNRLRGEFVSWVSHELRTPLTSIKGFLDLYFEDYGDRLSPDQRETLGIVDAGAQRLMVLINDLLEVSRVEGGGIELQRAPTDVAEVIRQVATTVRPQIEAKGQTLHLQLPEVVPLISGDADRISQVLINLVSNANKYSPDRGRITITAQEVEGWLRIAVADTGIGMTPEVQARLFTRFFRARDPETQSAGGTGLGLVIARSLVELHGGRMEVQSAKGIGSTFCFTLPIAQPALA